MITVQRFGSVKGLYVGPDPDDPHRPGLSLRARVNLSVRVTNGWAKVRCPYCGYRSKTKLKPGLTVLQVFHEGWCPVPVGVIDLPQTNREVIAP